MENELRNNQDEKYLHPTKGFKKYVRDAGLAHRYDKSRSTIWRWVRQGILPPPKKIAGSAMFDVVASDAAIEKGGADDA